MNKEFLGKKRFYLEDNPKTSIVGRIYIIETRSSEYYSVTLENGESYQIEFFDVPIPCNIQIQGFRDINNKVFAEFPSATQNHLMFRDRNDRVVGTGEVAVFDISGKYYYAANIYLTQSFKYKKNGWDFKMESGNQIVSMMVRRYGMLISEKFQLSCKFTEEEAKKLFP